jgi:putative Holliday junction resolvase
VAIVALDVGAKRIGVAVADPSNTFAMPVASIERTNLDADLARIMTLVESHQAADVVIGDPVRLSGERGIAAEKMDVFVERFRRVFSGNIHRVDERLTTAQASRVLLAADVSRKKRKRAVDPLAAALILETFLARRRNEQAQ